MDARAAGRVAIVAAFVIMVMAAGGCGGSGGTVGIVPGGGEINVGVEQVGAEELWGDIFGDSPPRVVDIRSPDDYEAYHIPGSENRPGGVGLAQATAAQGAQQIVLVGDKESQEVAVAAELIEAGMAPKILDGGLEKWQLGLDVNDETLKQWMKAGRGVVLIDVRTADEFDYAHIPGSVNRPLDEIEQWGKELDPSAEYIMICRSGVRSARARDTLAREFGLKRVHNLLGGVNGWGYELEGSGCG